MIASVAALWGYYVVTLLAVPVALRRWTRLPVEVVRKVQHLAYACSVFLLVGLFDQWYQAALAAGSLLVVAWPLLSWWRRHPSYARLLTDRRADRRELRRQLLLVQASLPLLVAVLWGGFGPGARPLIVAAAMVWGFGDAAAALVGTYLGRHRVVHRAIEGAKTYEGAVAMGAAALAAAFGTLLGYGAAGWGLALIAALVAAPLVSAIELFSRRGLDTVTVPWAAALALFPWWAIATFRGG